MGRSVSGGVFIAASRRGPGGGSRDWALHRGRPRVVGGLAEFRPDPSDVLAGDSTSAGGITGRRFAGFLRAWGALRRLRFVIAVLALTSAGLVLILWVLLPWLSAVRASGRPSVILVSIDTLRADRLGVLGSARPRTPLLDGIATEGMVFGQAMSAAPWTLPSHASLFASRIP